LVPNRGHRIHRRKRRGGPGGRLHKRQRRNNPSKQWLVEIDGIQELAALGKLRIKVARIFNTYGPRMHPNDGRVVSNFIIQALLGRDITIYGEGSYQIRLSGPVM
jgi:hypothetical protein